MVSTNKCERVFYYLFICLFVDFYINVYEEREERRGRKKTL